MAIAYIHPTTQEPVEKERWRWSVLYTDGSELHQFEIKDNKAIFHPFADIDQSRIQSFKLNHDSYKTVVVTPPEGAKLVHAYVNAVIHEPMPDGQSTQIIKLKGYKVGYVHEGRDYGILVDHNDSIRLLNDFDVILAPDRLIGG